MTINEALILLGRSPEVLTPIPHGVPDYYSVCAFLNGLCHDSGELRGFNAWLMVKRKKISASHWFYSVLEMAFPNGPPDGWRNNKEHQSKAIKVLLANVDEFLVHRNGSPNWLDEVQQQVDMLKRGKTNG